MRVNFTYALNAHHPKHPQKHPPKYPQSMIRQWRLADVSGIYAAIFVACGLGFGAIGGDIKHGAVHAQTSTINNNQPGTIGNNSSNNVIAPTSNQNANQNQSNPNNIINVPNIYPLQTPLVAPVNTENDFGLNFSLGMNTLDARNVTAFIGVIYQPGRTDSHLARMNRLNQETAILEQQKKLLEAQVSLLQQQAEEAKLRVEQLRAEQRQQGPGRSNSSGTIPNMVRPNAGAKSMFNSFLFPSSVDAESNTESSLNFGNATSNSNSTGSMGGLLPMVMDGR